MEIYVISEGIVLSYLLDPEFENKLPIIPSEVSYVNFTWKSGVKKYYYNFYRLKSFDESILKTPSITIKTQGRVPKRAKGKVHNPCLFYELYYKIISLYYYYYLFFLTTIFFLCVLQNLAFYYLALEIIQE